MSIKPHNKIAYRVVAILLFTAFLVALTSSFFFYSYTYKQEMMAIQSSLDRLVNAVSKTAAVAAYLDDEVLAQEVVNGIAADNFVKSVYLHSQDAVIASNQTYDERLLSPEIIKYPLTSPFFSDEEVGQLIIHGNVELIRSQARNIAFEHATLISIHSFILIFIILFLINSYLISAIKQLAQQLHFITPGDGRRLELPPKHNQDEISVLVDDINTLLNSAQKQIDTERTLRFDIEKLEKRFRTIFEQGSGGIALINFDGYLQVHNPSFMHILGKERLNRLIDQNSESVFDVLSPNSNKLRQAASNASKQLLPVSIDLSLEDDQQPRWIHCMLTHMNNDMGNPVLELILQDISERRSREQEFKTQAQRDPLTHLYNRRAGTDKIQHLLNNARQNNSEFAFFMIDLDSFKPINDSYGHEAGDRVLVVLADRLQSSVRADDIVIRWGGDEFLIMIRQSNQNLEASHVAKKLLTMIQKPIEISPLVEVHAGVSIGIAIFPHDSPDMDTLISYADKAMYHVKSHSKNNFIHYSQCKHTRN
ncbi:MAG: GGDEF domain-containing protein [Piscirickettsiaceae bacterium]|nr:GGDEF domain-containing protein [Piscirickettsiaceae bacterium]